MEGERYYVRLLLTEMTGCTSIADLKTLPDGTVRKTFREAAAARGPLVGDRERYQSFPDAASRASPRALAWSFAALLAYCSPGSPRDMWGAFFALPGRRRFGRISSRSYIATRRRSQVGRVYDILFPKYPAIRLRCPRSEKRSTDARFPHLPQKPSTPPPKYRRSTKRRRKNSNRLRRMFTLALSVRTSSKGQAGHGRRPSTTCY